MSAAYFRAEARAARAMVRHHLAEARAAKLNPHLRPWGRLKRIWHHIDLMWSYREDAADYDAMARAAEADDRRAA